MWDFRRFVARRKVAAAAMLVAGHARRHRIVCAAVPEPRGGAASIDAVRCLTRHSCAASSRWFCCLLDVRSRDAVETSPPPGARTSMVRSARAGHVCSHKPGTADVSAGGSRRLRVPERSGPGPPGGGCAAPPRPVPLLEVRGAVDRGLRLKYPAEATLPGNASPFCLLPVPLSHCRCT